MGIQFETDYNMETLTAMAKGLRKTVRKKRSRRVHIFAAVVLILGLLTILATVAGGEPLGVSGVVTLLGHSGEPFRGQAERLVCEKAPAAGHGARCCHV